MIQWPMLSEDMLDALSSNDKAGTVIVPGV